MSPAQSYEDHWDGGPIAAIAFAESLFPRRLLFYMPETLRRALALMGGVSMNWWELG